MFFKSGAKLCRLITLLVFAHIKQLQKSQIFTFAKKTLSCFVVLLKKVSKQNMKVVHTFYCLEKVSLWNFNHLKSYSTFTTFIYQLSPLNGLYKKIVWVKVVPLDVLFQLLRFGTTFFKYCGDLHWTKVTKDFLQWMFLKPVESSVLNSEKYNYFLISLWEVGHCYDC